MRTILCIALVTFSGTGFISAEETADQAAMRVLDEYMTAFNARDNEAWAATLNYPHVRIAGGNVAVAESAEEFAAGMDFEAFAKRFNWDHSEWGERTIIQSREDKVHVALTFIRYDPDGNKIATFESLYVITNRDGHWGVQARSSFAP